MARRIERLADLSMNISSRKRRISKMFSRKICFSFLIMFFACVALTPISQQPAMAKELNLIMAHYLTPAYKDVFPVIERFPDYVNERGKGRVHIENYHSGKLLQAEQLLPGLLQGTADIVLQVDSIVLGTSPIVGIIELPFLYKNAEMSYEKLKIGTPLYKLINQELAKKNLFMLATWPCFFQYIWTTNKPVRKPGDLKGLRIRAAGRVESMIIKALGGASTALSSAELYEALKRRTIDGALCSLTTLHSRGLQEAIGYVTDTPMASYSLQIYMRLDRWKELPPDIQELLIESAKRYEKGMLDHAIPYWNQNTWPVIWKAGIKATKLTQREEEEFKKAILPVWDWWKEQVPPGVGEKAIKLATE